MSERDERLAIRFLNEPKTSNATTVGRKLRENGLRGSDQIVLRAFKRQGLGARVKKSLLTIK